MRAAQFHESALTLTHARVAVDFARAFLYHLHGRQDAMPMVMARYFDMNAMTTKAKRLAGVRVFACH